MISVLKVFLKHKLYEYCIDLIFGLVTKNFTIPKSDDLHVGDIFEIIRLKEHFDNSFVTLTNVILVSYEEVVFFGEKYTKCSFQSVSHRELNYTVLMGEICDFKK